MKRYELPPEQREFVQGYMRESLTAQVALERFKKVLLAGMGIDPAAKSSFAADGMALIVADVTPETPDRPEQSEKP